MRKREQERKQHQDKDNLKYNYTFARKRIHPKRGFTRAGTGLIFNFSEDEEEGFCTQLNPKSGVPPFLVFPYRFTVKLF